MCKKSSTAAVLKQNRTAIKHLLAHSSRDLSLEQNLQPVNGRSVEVHLVQAGLIAAMRPGTGAGGTVFRYKGPYLLFADENGAPNMPLIFSLAHRRRFVVLEEYAHALHGDVTEDDPAGMLMRSQQEWREAEFCAVGYAGERLAAELAKEGELQRSQDVLDQKQRNGWIFPSDPAYLTRFPNLTAERNSW